ncbi:MAG: N-acetyltransferase [Lachnospiraceae bacterium]|nr:N-acetyltransferase [Lachnospiraceae bacterium]
MMKENIIYRLEKEDEYFLVENLVRDSFWNVYRPGAWERYVLHVLRNDKDFIKGLDYVMLKDYTLEKAREYGIGAVCFEGNIDFYGKSGFDYASRYGIRYHGLPDGEDASFFLCKELIPHFLDGVSGEYETPKGYMVSEKDVDDYDKKFSYKEKLRLDTQIF